MSEGAQLPWLWRPLAWVLRSYIKAVHATGRWQRVWHDKTTAHIAAGKPYIAVFWHGRLLMMPFAKDPKQHLVLLASKNKAGALTSTIVAPFNIGHVRGSGADPDKPHKNKGGMQALRGLLQALQKGNPVGITPDGPRGPACRMTLGAIQLARLSGVPIIPVTFSASGSVRGKGWDKMLWPLPFISKGTIMAGEPIFVSRHSDDAQVEACRQQVEQALNALTYQLDCTHKVERGAI